MSSLEQLSLNAREVLRRIEQHRAMWIGPAVVCGLLALVAALFTPRPWEATQAVVVRQEASASRSRPGKFADLYEMRTLQETILELARSRSVVVATLQAVEQAESGVVAEQPSVEEIDEFREAVTMLPPKGAEFGKTEVFYLNVKDRNRSRALKLVDELCEQLDLRLKALRNEQAEGLITELNQQVAMADKMQEAETRRLAAYEAKVGADLGELRMLNTNSSGQSDLRQQFVALENETRRTQAQARDSQQLLELLKAAQNDPDQIIATPNSLLVSQPALRRLKDGLVDSQLTAARLQGTRSAEHPRVAAALEAQESIRRNLHGELIAAIQTAKAELELNNARHANAREQLKEIEQRLTALAEQRAEYSNRVAAVETSRQTLSRVREQLNTAQASLSASSGASVLTPLDAPETGPSRTGVGLATMVAGGTFAGLTLGLGLVLLSGGPLAGEFAATDPMAQKVTQAEQPAPETEWWETIEEETQSASQSESAPNERVPTTPIATIAKPGYESVWEKPVAAQLSEEARPSFEAQKTMTLNTSALPDKAADLPRGASDFAGMSLQDAMLAAADAGK